jgi:hypothetical protein
MIKTSEAQRNILVVVPSRTRVAYVLLIEYAILMRESGNKVTILDLSYREFKYQESRFLWVIDNFSHKKNFPHNHLNIIKDFGIDLLKLSPREHKSGKTDSDMSQSAEFINTFRSTYAQRVGVSNFDLLNIKEKVVKGERKSYNTYYSETQKAINLLKVDLVVTFGGRLIGAAAIVRAAKNSNVEYNLVEIIDGHTNNLVIYSISPHSIREIREKIFELWQKVICTAPDQVVSLAVEAINKRLSPDWKWSTNGADLSILENKKYVAFFPTSDHEFAVFEGMNDEYPHKSQKEVFQIACRRAKSLDMTFVVRVHPQGKDRALARIEDKIWRDLCQESGSEFISAFSPVSSLSLAKNSFLNIVHSSSISLEIGYLGFNLAITCPTEFSNLITECEAFDQKSIEDCLLNPMKVSNPKSLLPYAYWISMGGQEISKFKIVNWDEIFFNGLKYDLPRKWVISFRLGIHYIFGNLRNKILKK